MNNSNYKIGFLLLLVILSGCDKRELREVKYDNGQLKESYYVKLDAHKNYVKDGPFSSYYENGQRKYECKYKNDKEEGSFLAWYAMGQKKKEGTYKQGKIEGILAEWYRNGQIEREAIYKDGIAIGMPKQWYDDGVRVSDSCKDIDGNVYNTVKIGNQVWTVENLRVTKYNDGTPIPNVVDMNLWGEDTLGAYCFYNNTTNSDFKNTYGALYDWYAVSCTNPKKIAPAGWHVPSKAELDTLENYLIANGYNWDGTADTTFNKIAKSLASKTDWETSTNDGAIGNDLTKNNMTGFTALPGGSRRTPTLYAENRLFLFIGSEGIWWCSEEETKEYMEWNAFCFCLDSKGEELYCHGNGKRNGCSVRLVEDHD